MFGIASTITLVDEETEPHSLSKVRVTVCVPGVLYTTGPGSATEDDAGFAPGNCQLYTSISPGLV